MNKSKGLIRKTVLSALLSINMMFAVGSAYAVARDVNEAGGLVEKVQKMRAQGDYEAVFQMRLLHPELSRSPQALECFAFSDQDLKNWKIAMQEFSDAARLAPTDVHIQISLIYGLYGAGAQDQALSRSDRIARVSPKDARIHAIRALIFQQLGSKKEALIELNGAEALGMSFPVWEAKYNYEIGNLDQAKTIKVAGDCLKKFPNDPQVLMFHGRAMRNAGRITAAEEDFRKVLKMNPNHMTALTLLADAYQMNKKYNQAVECLERRLKLAKSPQEARLANQRIAEVCEKNKDLVGAATARERMIAAAVQRKSCADTQEMKDILMCCHDLMEINRWQDAASRLSLVLDRFPDSSQALEKRAECYAKLNMSGEAVKDLDRLIEKNNDVASFYRQRADVLKRAGRAAESQLDLKQAEKLEAAQKLEESK